MRPGYKWVWRLLRGMRLSFKKPAKCLKELHSPALQEANTHRLFIKLSWLMSTHAVSADRVVNIDETSCRLLPGASHRVGAAAASNKLSCRATRGRRRRSRSPSAWTVARWTCWCRSCTRARQTPSCPSTPGRSARHIGERLGHDDDAPAARGHTGRRDEPGQGGTVVDPPLGHGQHPRQRGHPGRHEGRIPSRRAVLPPATKHVVPAALRRGRLPQLQELASRRRRAPLLPAPSSTAPSKAWP